MLDPKRVRPPHILFLMIAAAALLNSFLRPVNVIPAWGHVLGAGLFFIGMAGLSAARMQFKKHATPVRHSETPVTLVTDGLFAYSRNPMYVGALTMCFGLALWVGTWPFFLIPALLLILLKFVFIPWEEKLMAELFGEQYNEYVKRHRRWL